MTRIGEGLARSSLYIPLVEVTLAGQRLRVGLGNSWRYLWPWEEPALTPQL